MFTHSTPLVNTGQIVYQVQERPNFSGPIYRNLDAAKAHAEMIAYMEPYETRWLYRPSLKLHELEYHNHVAPTCQCWSRSNVCVVEMEIL